MLTVNTLGKFQIREADVVLDDDKIRSTRLSNLLVYLILHRNKTLTVDEIASALWQDEETNNPAGALKNLMYRLRNLMKQYFGEQEFIQTNRGSYRWNPDAEVSVDVEAFEQDYNEAKQHDIPEEEAKSCLERAILRYKGDFMPKILEMHWAVTMNTYYHSMYLSCVKLLSECYIKSGDYEKIEQICNEALNYDNVDEELHYYLIIARMEQNKLNLAMESYEKAVKILREELGIRKPEKLQTIYEELLSMSKGEKAARIEEVKENMTEENPEGVFLCGYPVFREIYRLEARKITRLGEAEHILLLTFEPDKTTEGSLSQVEEFRIRNAMERLEDTLKTSLRIGDVASRYSDSQYVVLLPTCNYENGRKVSERIINRFYRDNKKYAGLKIDVNLEEVTVAGYIVK